MYRKPALPSIPRILTNSCKTNITRTNFSNRLPNTTRFASNNVINYPGHIPTSTFSKILMGVGSAVHALSNPHRGDMIAVLGETTGPFALQKMYNRMASDEVGRLILKEKPIINETTINLKHLRTLPPTTFGGAYARWMGDREFTPDERSPVHFVDDPELAYVMRRYREAHDFWHVLSGTGTTVVAEIGVKWFELLQTGLPLCAISSFFGPLRLSWSDLYQLNTQLIPWAIRSSSKCKDLMNVYYEHHFEKDLNEFRKELNFEPFVEKQQ